MRKSKAWRWSDATAWWFPISGVGASPAHHRPSNGSRRLALAGWVALGSGGSGVTGSTRGMTPGRVEADPEAQAAVTSGVVGEVRTIRPAEGDDPFLEPGADRRPGLLLGEGIASPRPGILSLDLGGGLFVHRGDVTGEEPVDHVAAPLEEVR